MLASSSTRDDPVSRVNWQATASVGFVGPGCRVTERSGGPTPGAGSPADGASAIVAVAAGDRPGTVRFLNAQFGIFPGDSAAAQSTIQ